MQICISIFFKILDFILLLKLLQKLGSRKKNIFWATIAMVFVNSS